MRAVAVAQPNIALVKYWGKRDPKLNLPAVGSISVTLRDMHTRTEVLFDPTLKRDHVSLDARELDENDAEGKRVSRFLDLVRQRACTHVYARVVSRNDFPTAAGLASSASGFAALALASTSALGMRLSPTDLSALARQGSG